MRYPAKLEAFRNHRDAEAFLSATECIAIAVAAFLGGALNAVAGGGSFITFPTLVWFGMPAVLANSSSTVAMWPGSLTSAWTYRLEFDRDLKIWRWLFTVSALGGFGGARLLLATPAQRFERLVPFLLLAATLLFLFGNPATDWLKRHRGSRAPTTAPPNQSWLIVVQFFLSIYGGYFGGGMGIVMLAAFSTLGMRDIHTMNALKSLLAVAINGVAVVTFIIAGAVRWPQVGIMAAGAMLGGWLGAATARRVNPKQVRHFVGLVGAILSIWFFIR